jgi:hypothetical protein
MKRNQLQCCQLYCNISCSVGSEVCRAEGFAFDARQRKYWCFFWLRVNGSWGFIRLGQSDQSVKMTIVWLLSHS